MYMTVNGCKIVGKVYDLQYIPTNIRTSLKIGISTVIIPRYFQLNCFIKLVSPPAMPAADGETLSKKG